MPVYPIKDKLTGKSYDMPWDGPAPPTPDDAKSFILEQEKPKSTWDIANTPLTDLPSRAAKKISEPLSLYGEGGQSHPWLRKAARVGGAFTQALGDVTSSLTSPVNLGLTALTAGEGAAAKAGLAKTAQALSVPGRAAGVGMMGHGAYKAATEPTTSGKLGGAVEATLGLFGARPRGGVVPAEAPKIPDVGPVTPEVMPRPGLPPARPIAAGPSPLTQPIDAEFSVIPDRPLPAKPPQAALPPGKAPIYSGRTGLSPNIEDVTEPPQPAASPQSAAFNAMIPERYKPQPSNWGTTGQFPYVRQNPEEVFTGTGKLEDIGEPTPPPIAPSTPSKPAETPKSAMSGFSDSDIEFLSQTGDKDALAEASKRPSLKRLFQSEVGAVGDLKNDPLNPENPKAKTSEGDGEHYLHLNSWRQDMIENMGYPADEVEAAIADAHAHGIDPTRSDDLHDLGSYIEDMEYSKAHDSDFYEEMKQAGNIENPHFLKLRIPDTSATRADELVQKFGGTKQEPEPRDSVVERLKGEKGAVQIPGTSTPQAQVTREATQRWVYKRNAADMHGKLAAEGLASLKDPALVDKFEAGDRTGDLGKAQDILDEYHDELVDSGILKNEQYRQNYLQHQFKEQPEEVQRVFQTLASKPGFAKQSVFETFKDAEAAGLHRKFDNIPDIVGSYISQAKKALANKEFKDFLLKTGQLSEGASLSNKPGEWAFPDKASLPEPKLPQWIRNHLSPAEPVKQGIADTVAFSKNMVMGAGFPGTPANVHGYNIARREMMDQGFVKGTKSFLEGVFSPSKDRAILQKHRPIIPELMEHGFNWMDVEDHTAEGGNLTGFKSRLADTGKVGTAVAKGMNVQQSAFEKPLFERHLPARKLDMAARILTEEEPKIGRPAALKKAATISNDFYGGVDRALRNRDNTNIMRAIFFAPDWFESSMKMGAKEALSLVGKEDSRYAKALARSTIMRLTAEAPIVLAGGKGLIDEWEKKKASDVTNLPAGEAGAGKTRKNREVQTLGTASEATRLPEVALHKAVIEGDPRAAILDPVRDRLSPPMRSGMDLMMNQDETGNPLTGKDRFGRAIKPWQATKNTATQIARPLMPPAMSAMIDYRAGRISKEEAIARALGLPIKYSYPTRKHF